MNNEVVISLKNNNDQYASLINSIEEYCEDSKKTESLTGIEVVTLILNIMELIVAIVSIPMLEKAINNKEVIVKFKGFEMGNTAKEIIETIKNNAELKEEVKKALKKDKLTIKGNAKNALELKEKIKKIMEE